MKLDQALKNRHIEPAALTEYALRPGSVPGSGEGAYIRFHTDTGVVTVNRATVTSINGAEGIINSAGGYQSGALALAA